MTDMRETTETTEITIVLPRDLAEQLARVAQEEGRAQESLASDAVAEWLEDLADIAAADRVLAEGIDVTYSTAEVRDRLGLDD